MPEQAPTQWITTDGQTFEALRRRGLIKPGALVELANGDQYLVGDINPMGGVCDDCTGFHRDEVVTRYRIVWSG